MEPTIMKQLNFKKIFLNLLWPLLPFTAQAQENNTLYSILSKDSILVPSPSVQNLPVIITPLLNPVVPEV